MYDIIFILIAFFLGSLPFSYWIGILFLNTDIRKIADGNPGATNVFKTGKIMFGILAMVLDFSKGFLPVLLFSNRVESGDFSLILLCIAPILGHAFSPFLAFKGGKAVAVSFGIWAGLTLWVAPAFMGSVLLISTFFIKVKEDGWKVVFALASIAVALFFIKAPTYYWGVLVLNLLVAAYKHMEDLAKPLSITVGGVKWF